MEGRPLTAATTAWMNAKPSAVDSACTSSLTPLLAASHQVLHEHYQETRRYSHARYAFAQLCELFPDTHVETLTIRMLRQWVEQLKAQGNTANTINTKLSVVGVMFKHLDVERPCRVPYVRERTKLQWWLAPEMETVAVDWLNAEGFYDLADYIRFITRTGLRVEEALRLQRQHFSGLATDEPSVLVPGLKTAGSQATIPLSMDAASIVTERLGVVGLSDDYLFPQRLQGNRYRPRGGRNAPKTPQEVRTYLMLHWQWQACRKALGLADTPGATLKAFRRSFAYRLAQGGAPTEIIRQMLRHESITTTIGYLRVTGGFNTEMLRQWLR